MIDTGFQVYAHTLSQLLFGGNALTDALTVSSKICKQVETSKDGGPMDHWTRDKRGWSSMKGRVFPCILGTQTPCISEHRLLILKQVYIQYIHYTPLFRSISFHAFLAPKHLAELSTDLPSRRQTFDQFSLWSRNRWI